MTDQNDILPDRFIDRPSVDPIVLGLERKLDVLRAQLAASRVGEDPGQTGMATWSRLEYQQQQIQQLMQENAALTVANAAGGAPEMDRLRREAAATLTELERAREQIRIYQQNMIERGRAIATARSDGHDVAPQPHVDLWDTRMLKAMQISTCWRITRPVRVVGELPVIRQLRHAVRKYREST